MAKRAFSCSVGANIIGADSPAVEVGNRMYQAEPVSWVPASKDMTDGDVKGEDFVEPFLPEPRVAFCNRQKGAAAERCLVKSVSVLDR